MQNEKTVFQYAREIIIWFFSRKKWIGKKFYFQRRKRKVIKEGFTVVSLEGIKTPIPKEYLKTLSR